jgi:hypothetical protein
MIATRLAWVSWSAGPEQLGGEGSADAATWMSLPVRRTTFTATRAVRAASFSVPHRGSTNHVRSARWGPWYPDSSPSRASPGCPVRRTFTFSASMSARVAKSVGDLSKASQRFAVPGAHDGSARFRRGDGQLRVTEGHMLTTRAIPPASDSGTSFGSTVRSATGVVRNCCRDGGLQPRTKAADLKRSPHGASNGHRRRVLPCA